MTAAGAVGTKDNDAKSRSLVDSAVETAHKVALAGVGVAGEAADAGAKVFDRLVERGEKIEARGKVSLGALRVKAEERVEQVRSVAGERFEQTKSKARSGFEQTKSKARAGIDGDLERRLERLGLPGKADLEAVLDRLSAIEQRLDSLEKPKPRRRTAKKAPAKAE